MIWELPQTTTGAHLHKNSEADEDTAIVKLVDVIEDVAEVKDVDEEAEEAEVVHNLITTITRELSGNKLFPSLKTSPRLVVEEAQSR